MKPVMVFVAKVKLEFATETIEVEVSAEMYALHMELDRVEYNNNHRETRRHVSLDTCLEHSDWLRSYDSDVYQQIAAEEDAARIRAAIDALSDSQKDLIQKIFDEGMSIKDYAEECGVKPSAISHRCRTDFADIQNKKECGGNRQWQNHYLRNWAANTKGKGII